MGFITRTFKRRFEFKHFGVSHTLDHAEPGYEKTDVYNPSSGQTVIRYVQKFDAVEGVVTGAEWYDRTDDANTRYVGYKLTVDVDDEIIELDFPYGKPAYRALMRHGPNVDWSKRVRFSAWKSKNNKGQDTHGVCFWQTGADGKDAVVKSAHTVENPNGCPAPVQKMNGKWDFNDSEIWLKKQFDKVCLPKIKATGEKHKPHPAAKAAVATAMAGAGDPNDPFGDFSPADAPPEIDDSEIPF